MTKLRVNRGQQVRVRNSTYDALKALSQAENKAMSVIIDQLVQERVIGGPYSVTTSQRSTPDGKRTAARGRRSSAYYDDALPDDVQGLHELVATLQAELQEARAELAGTHQDNAHLQAEYTTLWVRTIQAVVYMVLSMVPTEPSASCVLPQRYQCGAVFCWDYWPDRDAPATQLGRLAHLHGRAPS